MDNREAIHKLEFMRNAYQKLIDEKVDSGRLVGTDVTGTWKAETPLNDAYQEHIDALTLAIAALEQQEQDRWRPVSEALPKKEAEYNVTIKDEYGPPYVGVCYWNDNDNVFEDWDGYYEDRVPVSNVIAWRPLPELYKEDKT